MVSGDNSTVQPVWVRSTINLPNLPLGERAAAMPDDPYVAMCIRNGLVVIEGPVEVLDGD